LKENLKVIEGEIVSIYENNEGERLINARELHEKLKVKRDFTTWLRDRIDKYKFKQGEDYTLTFPKIGGRKNVVKHEYWLSVDMSKELCMIENNEMGRKIRKYFIEVEKRYRSITEAPKNIFDVMHLALNQIEKNEKRLSLVENIAKENKEGIEDIKKRIFVIK